MAAGLWSPITPSSEVGRRISEENGSPRLDPLCGWSGSLTLACHTLPLPIILRILEDAPELACRPHRPPIVQGSLSSPAATGSAGPRKPTLPLPCWVTFPCPQGLHLSYEAVGLRPFPHNPGCRMTLSQASEGSQDITALRNILTSPPHAKEVTDFPGCPLGFQQPLSSFRCPHCCPQNTQCWD